MGKINKDDQALIMVIVIHWMVPLYFPKLIWINYDLMLRMKWLTCAKFDADLINMSQVVKQSGLAF